MKNSPIILKPLPYFINFNRYFSYTHCSTFIIIGGRGIGKTTGFALKSAKDFLKDGEQFVYVKRYKTEASKSKDLFSKVMRDVTTAGIKAGAFTYNYKKEVMGWCIPLTTASSFKSGCDFSKVTKICFDEAILKRNGTYRYLQDEVVTFFELISTIVRTRKNYKIFILGNNADLFNIYFDYFKVPRFDNIYVNKERGLYCELSAINPLLLEKEKETPLYALTKGTAYGDYHYNNAVLVTDNYRLDVKQAIDKLLIRIVYNTFTLNIYRHNGSEIFVELRDKIIKDATTFVIMENNNPNYYYIGMFRKSDIYKYITYAYYNDFISYESNKCAEIFSLFIEEI